MSEIDAAQDREKLMFAIVGAAKRIGVARQDLSEVSGPQCLYLLSEIERCAARPSSPFGWRVKRVGDAIHIESPNGRWCGYMRGADGPAHDLTYEFLSAMLASTAADEPEIQL